MKSLHKLSLGLAIFFNLLISRGVFAQESLPPRPQVLTLAAVSGVESRGLKAVIPLWEKEKGIRIRLIEYPYHSLYEKLVTTLQVGVPTFDLIMIDDPWMPKFGSNAWLVPLDEAFGYRRDSDIFPIAYDVCTWPPPRGPIPPGDRDKSPHLFALPLVGNVEIFMYRKDVLSGPGSWEDVLAAARKVHDPRKPLFGFVIRGAKGNPVISQFFPILLSFGGRIFDENWRVVLNSKEALRALQFFAQKLKTYAPPGVEAFDAAERSREIAAGRGAQATVWPAEITDIVENPKVSSVVGKMGYTVIPAGPGGIQAPLLGFWLLGIPRSSKNQAWAFEFLKWVTSPKTQRAYAEAGGIPFRKSLLFDPKLGQKFPFFKALAGSLEAPAFWRPRTEEWFAVEAILGTYVNAALAGQLSPEEALQRAAAEIHAHMKEAGYYP